MAVGILRGKRVDHLSLDWDIQDYFTSRIKHVIRLQSPQFAFGGCAWRLLIYPFIDPYHDNIGNSEIYLERLETSIVKHYVSFTIGIKNRDGSTYKCKECTSSFHKSESIVGYSENYSKTIVLDSQSELAAEGNLTIFIQDLVLNKVVVDNDGEQTATPTDEERNSNNDEKQNRRKKDDTDSVFKVRLLREFNEMFLNQGESDITFKVEDCEIHAHREVLGTASVVFTSMFGHVSGKNTGIVNIHDWGAEAFKELLLLLYVYPGLAKNTSSVITFDLYEASIKDELKHLKKKCIEIMKKDMSIDTFCNTMTIALKHKETEFVNYATDFFARNMQLILPTEGWKMYLKDNYLSANDLIINAMKDNYFFKSHSGDEITNKNSEEFVVI